MTTKPETPQVQFRTRGRLRKRAYSKEFQATDDVIDFFLGRVPAGLWAEIRAKAARENVSMRTLILRLLSRWLAQPPARRPSGRVKQ